MDYKIFYKLSLKKNNKYLFERTTISILENQDISFIPSINDGVYFEKNIILEHIFTKFKDILDEDILNIYFKVIDKIFYYYIDDETNLKSCEITIQLEGEIL